MQAMLKTEMTYNITAVVVRLSVSVNMLTKIMFFLWKLLLLEYLILIK